LVPAAYPESGPILVGVDFSEGSRVALAWAVDAALAFHTTLIALHVVHDPAESPGYYASPRSGPIEDLEHVASRMMREFVAETRAALPRIRDLRRLDTAVVVGLAVTRVLEVAEREGARLIVMGGQGRTALADALLGSKVERVTRLSPIPVTVVKTGGPRSGKR
jgi:nucleotide-binding universal stress UspA family protein